MARLTNNNKTFGFITKNLLQEVIGEKKKDSSGNQGISKAGQRALEIRHGRAVFGLGSRVITESSLTNREQLRDVDLERIVRNSGSRQISNKRGVGLRLKEYDSKINNRLLRYFHNSVSHLTAFRKSNISVAKHASQMIRTTLNQKLSALLARGNFNISTQTTLKKCVDTLTQLSDMQLSHYSKGTGLRNMKLDHLVRLTTVIDEIMADIEIRAIQDGDNFRSGYVGRIGQWLQPLARHHGHQNVNDFINKVYKNILEGKGDTQVNHMCKLQTVDEIQHAMMPLKLAILRYNVDHSTTHQINGNLFLQCAIYEDLEKQIRDIPLPISSDTAAQLVHKMNELRAFFNLQGKITATDLFPEGGVMIEYGDEVAPEGHEFIANTYINMVDLTLNRVRGGIDSKNDLIEAQSQILQSHPSLSMFLGFVNAAQDYIDTGREFALQEMIADGSVIEREIPNQRELLVLQQGIEGMLKATQNDTSASATQLKPLLENLKDFGDEIYNEQVRTPIKKKIEDLIDNDDTTASKIRFKRFRKGLYNIVLGKTMGGQVVRTLGKVGLSTTGITMTALTAPGAMISTGGNALLEAIRLIELKKLGIAVGIAAAGTLPWFISPLRRDASNRKIRKLNNVFPKGIVQPRTTFSGDLEFKNKLLSKERARVNEYNSRDHIPKDFLILEKEYQEIVRMFNQTRGLEGGFVNASPEMFEKIQSVQSKVNNRLQRPAENNDIATALKKMERSLLSMSYIHQIESYLRDEFNQGKLVRDAVKYTWNTRDYPAKDMSSEDVSKAVSSYIVASLVEVVTDKEKLYQANLEADRKLIQMRLEECLHQNIYEPSMLVPLLSDEDREKMINMFERVMNDFPTSVQNSNVFHSMWNALHDVVLDDGSQASIHGDGLNSVGDINDLRSSLVQGNFMEVLHNILQQYSPYTTRAISLEHLQSLYAIFDDYDTDSIKGFRGAFVTEVVHSLLHSPVTIEGYKETAQWLKDIALKEDLDHYELKDEIELQDFFLERSLNDQVKVSPYPRETLAGLLESLDYVASDKRVKMPEVYPDTKIQPQRPDNVPSASPDIRPDAGVSQSQTTKMSPFDDIIKEARENGDIEGLVSPSVLLEAERKGYLGYLIKEVVDIACPARRANRESREWVETLFDCFDNPALSGVKGQLYALTALEIEKSILQSMSPKGEFCADIARCLIDRTMSVNHNKSYAFHQWIDFNVNEQINGLNEATVQYYSTNNIQELLKENILQYFYKDLENFRSQLEEAFSRGNLSEILSPTFLRRGYKLQSLGDVAYCIVKMSRPSDPSELAEGLWIRDIFNRLDGLSEEIQRNLLGAICVELGTFISKLRSKETQQRLSEVLLKTMAKVDKKPHRSDSSVSRMSPFILFNSYSSDYSLRQPELWNSANVRNRLIRMLNSYAQGNRDNNEGVEDSRAQRGAIPAQVYSDRTLPPLSAIPEAPSYAAPQLPSYDMPDHPLSEEAIYGTSGENKRGIREGSNDVPPYNSEGAGIPVIPKQVRQDLLKIPQGPVPLSNNLPELVEPLPTPTIKGPETGDSSSMIMARIENSVKMKLENAIRAERESLHRLYDEARKQYSVIHHDILKDGRVDSVNNVSNVVHIVSTYLKLESMASWSALPDDFSSYVQDDEILKNVQAMLQNLKMALIDVNLCIGVRAVREGDREVLVRVMRKGNHLLTNHHSFNASLNSDIISSEGRDGQVMSFSQVVAHQLLNFAQELNYINHQRSLRQTLLKYGGYNVSLESNKLTLSDIAQGLVNKTPQLRNMLETGTETGDIK